LWAEELREAALAIGRIRGRNLPGTAFEEIFTKFCIGK
jgi:tRNA U34 5-carboxymethylaminomethyl modifying GTPase MnmE/TrmE